MKLKKNHILIAIAFVRITLKAQVPNGSFEVWKKDTNYALQAWEVSSMPLYKKIAGQSGSAVQLNNVSNGTDIDYNMISLSGTNSFGSGPAFPWTYVCDSLRITYKCALGTDSATISSGLNRTGEDMPAFLAVAHLSGNQSTWKTITVPFEYLGVPDSVPDSAWVVILPHDDSKNTPGWVAIDNIEFVKNSTTLPTNIPNGDFEDWNSIISNFPQSWITSDKFASINFGISYSGAAVETTDAYSGSKAIKFTKGILGGIFEFPGVAMSEQKGGEPDEEEPAFKINARYASFRGYYKSSVSAPDRFRATANLFFGGQVVATATFIDSVSKSGYTFFNEDFEYDGPFSGVPDSALVSVGVYNNDADAPENSSSWVIVDELSFSQYFAGTDEIAKSTYKIFPNPASSVIYIQANLAEEKNTVYLITDLSGKEILKGNLKESINTSSLTNGCYLLTIKSDKGTQQQKIIIQQ